MFSSGIAFTLTEIGFWPLCSRSSTPGVPTNLQTNTLRLGADVGTLVVVVTRGWVVVVAGCVVVEECGAVVVVPAPRQSLRSGSGWPTSNAITSERP